MKKITPAFAVALLASPLANGAAILTDNAANPMSDGGATGGTKISVTAGDAGYASFGGASVANPINTTFNGTLLDYSFYNTASAYAKGSSGTAGASRFSNLTNPGATDNKTSLWETSATSGAADFTGGGLRSKAETGTGNGTSFTVDISGLEAGSVYVLNGTWQARADWLEVTMSGAGQADVTTWNDGGTANDQFGFTPRDDSGIDYTAKQIDFADAGLYTSIKFTVYESGNSDGYFSGAVLSNVTLDSVPEPSSTALLGLGGLALILRRRK